MLTYCVDFDDLCDGVAQRSLDVLRRVKDAHPAFQATLFTIPNRTSDATISLFKEYPWLSLAPHGWHHTRGECLAWTSYEAADKINKARDRGIDAPVFRAPAWLINRATYEACRDLHITVADHKDNYLGVVGCRVYRYNDPAWRVPKLRTVHGHLTDCAVDNFIVGMVGDGRLSFAAKSAFTTPWEAGRVVTEANLTTDEVSA